MDHAVFFHPLDRVLEGTDHGILRQAQFADGFGRVEIHLVFRHFHPAERHRRRLVGDDIGNRFAYPARGIGHPVGHFNAGRRDAGDFLQGQQDFMQGQVAVAQDVTFTDGSFLLGEEVAPGAIPDIDQIQPGIEISGHLAVDEIEDKFSRGRRFDVPRSDRRARVDHHHRQSPAGKLEGRLLGLVLGQFVIVAQNRRVQRRLFIRRAAVRPQADATDGAGINHLPDIFSHRRFQNVAGALDIDVVHHPLVPAPQAVIRGGMVQHLATLQGGGEGVAVPHISGHHLGVQTFDVGPVRVGAHQNAHVSSVGDQFAQQGRSQKARGAGHQCFHDKGKILSLERRPMINCVTLSLSKVGTGSCFERLRMTNRKEIKIINKKV